MMGLPRSEREIDAARTARGGWTRAQLSAWGVPWPPPRGWRKRLLNEVESPEPLTQSKWAEHRFASLGEARLNTLNATWIDRQHLGPWLFETVEERDAFLAARKRLR